MEINLRQKYFNRFEIKYQISMIQKNILSRQIHPFMELDPYVNNNHNYEVRSVYFDSPFRKSFFEKINGVGIRVKLRIRYYPDFQNGNQEFVFLELKKKINENVSKSRILVPFLDAFEIIDNSTEKAKNFYNKATNEDKIKLKEMWYLFNRYNLKPICVVCYNREPYMDKMENRFRLTFDTNVRVRYFDFDLHSGEGSKYVVPPNLCIMEIKFNNFIPNWIIKIFQKNNIIQEKTSKFANGLERGIIFSIV
ncbi:MAG: VTC domain-containing protein [Promethearchaeota archaeon]